MNGSAGSCADYCSYAVTALMDESFRGPEEAGLAYDEVRQFC